MASAKTILMLGGGIGGIVSAVRLRKRLSREHRIVLVERSSRYIFTPSFLWLMTGLRKAEQISRPLSELGKKGIEIVTGDIQEIDPERHTIRVSGTPFKCPAAPYEAAMLIEYDCRKRKIRQDVKIDLYTPEPGPMGVAGPEISKQVRQMVEAKDISFHPEHAVTKVDPTARQIHFTNGATADFNLLVYVPPPRAPQIVQDAGLTGESGWR